MKLSMAVLVVLLLLVASFAVQNPGVITVRFLHLAGDTSLLVVIVAGFGAGILGGWIAGLPGIFRRRSEAAAAKSRIRELEAQIEDLRRNAGGPKPGGTP